MAERTFAERRQHRRYPLATSIRFHHGPSQGDYPGRCVDVSAGGMLMYVPPNVPVRVGQPIRLPGGSFTCPGLPGFTNIHVDATVVRVDRGKFVATGQLAVGVRFSLAT